MRKHNKKYVYLVWIHSYPSGMQAQLQEIIPFGSKWRAQEYMRIEKEKGENRLLGYSMSSGELH